MRKTRHILLTVVVALISLASSTIAATDDFYEYGKASRDGIGKYYLGREISHVIGHLGAAWC